MLTYPSKQQYKNYQGLYSYLLKVICSAGILPASS